MYTSIECGQGKENDNNSTGNTVHALNYTGIEKEIVE